MTTVLRLAFMGTPDFSVAILAALIDAGHDIAAVYCQPPRHAGRGQKLRPSPVQKYAEDLEIEVRSPSNLKDDAAAKEFAQLNLDCAVVAAYGLILPPPILAAPRLGCVNVHASLLPRWRGAAPIQRAIIAGDAHSGVTIMQMDQSLDTGAILAVEETAITGETTGESLHHALAEIGAGLIVKTLDGIADGTVAAVPQPVEGVTYASKLDRDEGRFDWAKPGLELERLVRAFSPWPGTWFKHHGERIKILAAAYEQSGRSEPGKVADGLRVACGEGSLTLIRVQRAGKKPMSGEEFLRGFDLPPGSKLE